MVSRVHSLYHEKRIAQLTKSPLFTNMRQYSTGLFQVIITESREKENRVKKYRWNWPRPFITGLLFIN